MALEVLNEDLLYWIGQLAENSPDDPSTGAGLHQRSYCYSYTIYLTNYITDHLVAGLNSLDRSPNWRSVECCRGQRGVQRLISGLRRGCLDVGVWLKFARAQQALFQVSDI